MYHLFDTGRCFGSEYSVSATPITCISNDYVSASPNRVTTDADRRRLDAAMAHTCREGTFRYLESLYSAIIKREGFICEPVGQQIGEGHGHEP